MAGLPPANGLYVSFFSAMMYFFFGTSHHLSMGTYGIVSVMLDSYMSIYEGRLFPFATYRQGVLNGSMSDLNKGSSSSLFDTLVSGSALLDHLTLGGSINQQQPASLYPQQPLAHISGGRLLSSYIEGHGQNLLRQQQLQQTVQPTQYLSTDPVKAKVMLASAFAFYTGIFHVHGDSCFVCEPRIF